MNILEELGLYPSYVSSREAPGSRTFVGDRTSIRATIQKKENWLLELGIGGVPNPNRFSVGDVFAKALPRERFEQCRDALGVRSSGATSHQSAEVRMPCS